MNLAFIVPNGTLSLMVQNEHDKEKGTGLRKTVLFCCLSSGLPNEIIVEPRCNEATLAHENAIVISNNSLYPCLLHQGSVVPHTVM